MKAKAEQSEVVRRALAMLQSPSPAPRQEAPAPQPAQKHACFSCGTATGLWEANKGTCWARWVCQRCQGKVAMPTAHLCDPSLPLTEPCRGVETRPQELCSVCGKPARVEEVNGEARTFWTCPHCQATGKPYITQEEPFPLKELYRQMTQDPLFDDFPLIDSWLCDNHPALWRKIREIDNELCRLESERAEGERYQAKLAELLAACQEARRLYTEGKRVKIWFQ